MIRARISVILSAAALATTACTGAAEQVRPDEISAGEAIGESFACTEEKLAGDLSPFTADWSDGQRAALEAAMKRGVAVVSMTCEGPKVLKACSVLGDYAYSGVSLKTKLVEMADQGSAAVNLGGMLSSPSFKSALEQGRSLMLAYMIAGVETTTVSEVGPLQLKGRCDGATHFVYEAQLGAFSMETAEKGTSATAADFLIGDAAANTSSEKSTKTTDGDPGSCEWASESDEDKTEGCSALMRVDLMSISAEGGLSAAPVGKPAAGSEEKKASAVRVVGCPDGYTWDGDSCQPAAAVPFELCDEFDTFACREQCGKGSMESCNRFANDLLLDYQLNEALYEGAELVAMHSEWAQGLAADDVVLMETACDEEMPTACALLGYSTIYKDDAIDMDTAVPLLGKACELGDAEACKSVGAWGILVADELKYPPLARACDRGVAVACAIWAEEQVFSAVAFAEEGAGAVTNIPPSVTDKAMRACYGGYTGYCAFAAGLLETSQPTCVDRMARGWWVSGNRIEGQWADDMCKAKFASGIEGDDLEPLFLLNAACDAGDAEMCEYLDDTGMRLDPAMFDDLDLDLDPADDIDLSEFE